jgi:hypothetical protein
MPGPHRQEWGFLYNNHWVQHEEYFKLRRLLNSKD